MSGNVKMTVNVSLCGSIPRSEMSPCTSRSRPSMNFVEESITTADAIVGMTAASLSRQVSEDDMASPPKVFEPPSWAVAARGESFLEPVGDSKKFHRPLDLTKSAVFWIGRSDASDLQLLHCASSRRHAILFHHPNGHCYVIDCGSAHGTYVNGVKLTGQPSRKKGLMLHKVRKGSLFRFGGPGAPSFILKSFSVKLTSILGDLEKNDKCLLESHTHGDDPCFSNPGLSRFHSNGNDDALVLLNTRLNSVSNASSLSCSDSTCTRTVVQLMKHQGYHSDLMSKRKRNFVSFDDEGDYGQKKSKIPDSSLCNMKSKNICEPAVVSPSRDKSTQRFDFSFFESKRPVVSPNPFEHQAKTMLISSDIPKSVFSIPPSLALPLRRKRKKTVSFSQGTPEYFYHA